MSKIVVAALYRFTHLPDFQQRRQPLLDYCQTLGIKGTLLLASEGLNGTVAGSREAIDQLLSYLCEDPNFTGVGHHESFHDEMPFYRMKVKLKKEIVTMGVEDIDPSRSVGAYVEPKDWNDLVSDPEVTLIDTRNTYECAIGSFRGAIDPKTRHFREFPQFAVEALDPGVHKKVAMFCTGGIRCEKSTAYMKEQGFEDVYHLEGGILKYLEEVPKEETMWEGECFVFDNRVAVDHDLQKGSYDQCHACRMPITEDEKLKPEYMEGVSCHHCIDDVTDEQRERFAERQKQIELAQARGEGHIGNEAQAVLQKRKEAKKAQKDAQRKK